ncbi:MAG: heme/copper-type cytochrome/quinol oxidase subunit 3 [Clostridium sp.]|jgi:heme/copper-type cytochrome/quinol oxidase subunit 3
MKNKNKTIMFIFSIYLIHLFFYIFMSYITFINMSTSNRVWQKLKLNSNIIEYNHLYISAFYLILSTYLMCKALNFSIHKLIKILIYTISYAFVFIAAYKYYSSKEFVNILLIANGLIISLNLLYKKINISKNVI